MIGVKERPKSLFGQILVASQCTMPCTGGRCHLCLFGTLHNRSLTADRRLQRIYVCNLATSPEIVDFIMDTPYG